jgi:hypothetical protein
MERIINRHILTILRSGHVITMRSASGEGRPLKATLLSVQHDDDGTFTATILDHRHPVLEALTDDMIQSMQLRMTGEITTGEIEVETGRGGDGAYHMAPFSITGWSSSAA